LVVQRAADRKGVFPGLLEAVSAIEGLGAPVLAPHAQPLRSIAVALAQMAEGEFHQRPAVAAALLAPEDIDALDLAMRIGPYLGMWQVRRETFEIAGRRSVLVDDESPETAWIGQFG